MFRVRKFGTAQLIVLRNLLEASQFFEVNAINLCDGGELFCGVFPGEVFGKLARATAWQRLPDAPLSLSAIAATAKRNKKR